MRHDGRQGTIDQDPEFIDFLHSLTEPVTKPTGGGEEVEAKTGKIAITPLVQYIKDKKANKAKDPGTSKASKATKGDSKDAKSEKAESKKVSVIKAAPAAEKARREKATQDAVKAINKSVAALSGRAATPKGSGQTTTTKDAATTQTPPKRERERGSASAAAKILQRDLGLSPKERRASGVNKSSAATPEATKSSPTPAAKVNLPVSSSQAAPKEKPVATTQEGNVQQNSSPSVAPTGPRNTKPSAPAAQTSKSSPTPTQRQPKSSAQPSVGAKSAFLKHANPSQGVTEPLLHAAFSAFGTLTRCEIDKKKGFGYVDFDEPDGLKKAMQASPVKIGNGQVVVLENKSKTSSARAPASQNSVTTQSKSQPAPPPATNTEPSSTTTAAATTPATATSPPPAPRGAGATPRGNRGGHVGSNRGGFTNPGRGGRGGFRGRGGSNSNQNRGGGNAAANATASSESNTTTTSPATTGDTAGGKKPTAK